jgi:hypothetical protein
MTGGRHRWTLLVLVLLLLGTPQAVSVGAQRPPSSAAGATPPPTTGIGEITVRLLACPAGMRPLDLVVAACSPDAAAARLLLVGPPSAPHRTNLPPTTQGDAHFVWQNLPFGLYGLKVIAFAPATTAT